MAKADLWHPNFLSFSFVVLPLRDTFSLEGPGEMLCSASPRLCALKAWSLVVE